MNFTISKNRFLAAIQTVNCAITPNSPHPALKGIKIEAKEDGTLVLTGSDSNVSIRKTLSNEADPDLMLTISEFGGVVIDSKYLTEIIRKMDSEMVHVYIIDGALTCFQGNQAEFKINGMKAVDYPSIDFSRPVSSVKINAETMKQMISQTVFAASTKDTRPVLTGVNFKMANGVLSCTATDSYRLSRKTIPFDSDVEFNVTIPSRSLNDLNSTLLAEPKEDIEFAEDSKKAQFISSDTVLQTKLLDGGYPDTDRLIPKEFKYELTISRDDLIRAIDRTTFLKNDNMTVNRLQCSQGEIILTNKSQEIGESHEELMGTFVGDPLDISFSGTYVMEAAKALRGSNLVIKFTGEMRPFILTDMEDDTIIQLVLPIRTYN